MAVLFLAGFAVGALVAYRTAQKPEAPVENTELTLSDSTRAVLESLKSPLQIQFYALFGEDTTSGELREFAARVKQLLTAFEQAAKGKIKISPISSWSDDNARSAAAAGVVPVNAGSDAAYLGLVVGQKERKETLVQLRPEWEAAIEFDLARAISRVAKPPQAQLPAADVAMAEKAAEAVQRTIPNLNSVSLEEGKRILRAAALEEYMAAVIGMEKEVNEAKQRVIKAEAGSSEADLQAAREQLRLIQARRAEKLSQITARSQAQIEAFQRMK
jgi:hypothetical protein